MRDELKTVKEQNAQLASTLQQQSNLLNANNSGTAQQAQSRQRDDDDIITYADLKQVMGDALNPVLSQLAENRVAASKSDFEDVVKNGLPLALKADPTLREAIQSSKNPAALAYRMAKLELEVAGIGKGKSDAADDPTPEEIAAQLKANQQKPGSASAASDTGGGVGDVNKFATMSDEEFAAHVSKVKMKG